MYFFYLLNESDIFGVAPESTLICVPKQMLEFESFNVPPRTQIMEQFFSIFVLKSIRIPGYKLLSFNTLQINIAFSYCLIRNRRNLEIISIKLFFLLNESINPGLHI